MILLIAVIVVVAFVFFLMGMADEHDRPGGTKDLRRKLYRERERSADLRLQLDRAVSEAVAVRDQLVYGASPLPEVLPCHPALRVVEDQIRQHR